MEIPTPEEIRKYRLDEAIAKVRDELVKYASGKTNDKDIAMAFEAAGYYVKAPKSQFDNTYCIYLSDPAGEKK